jgi:peptidoglycan/LPS O-acetylase OafA/YrhL
MTAPPASELALNRALRRVHRSVLVTLAVCAAVIAVSSEPEAPASSANSSRGFTYTAIALGVTAIVTRRRQAASAANPRAHVALSVASLLSACGVGITGVAAGAAGEARTTALAFVLAGAIFALRPPTPIAMRPPAEIA